MCRLSGMLRRRHIPFIMAVALLVARCPRYVRGPAGGARLTAKEIEALEAIRDIYGVASSSGNEIWPGFDPREFPLLVFRPGRRSFLIGAGMEMVGLDPVESIELGVPVFALDSGNLKLNPHLPFAREVNVAGHTAFMVRHEDSSSRDTWFRVVVHELFHQYQRERFRVTMYPQVCRYPYGDVENAFLSRVEDLVLARQVAALPDKVSRDDYALFVALRSRRYGREDSGRVAQKIEEWEELVEGTARYVEHRYAVEAGVEEEPGLLARLSTYLSNLHPRDLQKWKYYRTGLAQALVLDALGLVEWKAAAEAGRSLYDYAADALHNEIASTGLERLDREVESHALLRKPTREALDKYLHLETALLRKWEKEGSNRITILLPERGGAYYVNRGLTFNLEDCSRLVTGIVSFVDQRHGLEICGKGISFRNFESSYWIVFYDDWGKTHIELDGHEVPGRGRFMEFSNSVRIEGSGWTLDTQGAGTITVEGREVEIRLR